MWSQVTWNLRGQHEEFELYLEGNGLSLNDFKKENITSHTFFFFFRLLCGKQTAWMSGNRKPGTGPLHVEVSEDGGGSEESETKEFVDGLHV